MSSSYTSNRAPWQKYFIADSEIPKIMTGAWATKHNYITMTLQNKWKQASNERYKKHLENLVIGDYVDYLANQKARAERRFEQWKRNRPIAKKIAANKAAAESKLSLYNKFLKEPYKKADNNLWEKRYFDDKGYYVTEFVKPEWTHKRLRDDDAEYIRLHGESSNSRPAKKAKKPYFRSPDTGKEYYD